LLNSKDKRNSGGEFSLPANETEQALLDIWKQVLGHGEFGTGDDFFIVGGNSLKAVQVASRMSKKFSLDIQLTDVYLKTTITQLSLLIAEQEKLVPSNIKLGSHTDRVDIPLSFSQERLWFIDQLEGTIHYHIPEVFRLTGPLNETALTDAFREIIKRHEVLRTVIESKDGHGYQLIRDNINWNIEKITAPPSTSEEEVRSLVLSVIDTPFNLMADDMIRVHLIRLGSHENILVITLHHIASDGWSMAVLLKELKVLYEAFLENAPNPLKPLEYQYADYSIWHRRVMEGTLLQSKLQYWKQKLDGVAPLQLPVDFVRPAVQTTRGRTVRFTIEEKLVSALSGLSKQLGATLFMTTLSAFKVMLYRYSGQEDICVGTAIANRTTEEVEELIGFFVNTLALRSRVDPEASFEQLLADVKRTTIEAYQHQDVPFEKVVDVVVKERDLSRNPLFQVMFVWQNTLEASRLGLKNIEVAHEFISNDTSKFDLTFSITQNNTALDVVVEYNTDLFGGHTIDGMIAHFQKLLYSIIDTPKKSISILPMLTDKEVKEVLHDFNQTTVDHRTGITTVDLFQEQAERNADKLALTFGTQKLTYSELNERSNQVAHYLIKNGVAAGSLVPVCLHRGVEMITGIFGILKAGAAYVPVDPEYPLERIEYILRDTNAGVIVTSSGCNPELRVGGSVKSLELDTDEALIAIEPKTNPGISIEPHDLAYIIYTSGSTGKPKGVMIEHSSLTDKLLTETQLLKVDKSCLTALTTNYIFDASLLEIFLPLVAGGGISIPTKEIIFSANDLIRFLDKEGVSIIQGTPSFIQYILSGYKEAADKTLLKNLQQLCIGGESLQGALVDELREFLPHVKINNHYGPTETTIDAIVLEGIEGFEKNIIGRPVFNARVYLLDDHQNLVPKGVPGEICVAGRVLARGYLNSPELTAEKFVTNPFEDGGRMYKTGDQGRWTGEGTIEFLGRKDEQVKIRGNRLELGEIESILHEHDKVHQAVIKVSNTADKTLQAYIVSKDTRSEFWPSMGEYPVYDELLYFAMTHDEKRVVAYKEAIRRTVGNKTVVEIGTGKDAILARLCVEAGASKVYAIEMGKEAFEQAQTLIEELGYEDKIELLFGDAMQMELPELVDVCVSEIIGTIGGSEGAAVILNNAQRFLKPGGIMLPEKCITRLAAVSIGDDLYNEPSFSELGDHYVNKVFEEIGHEFNIRLCIKNLPQQSIISNDCIVEELLFNERIQEEYANKFRVQVNKDARFDGLLLWINLVTSAEILIDSLNEESSWLPVYFPIFYPGKEVAKGDIIEGQFIVALSENGVNPDYKIAGQIISASGEITAFEFESQYASPNKAEYPFYKKIHQNKANGIKSVAKDEEVINDIRAYLGKRLPSYMVPNNFHFLKKLPLLPNGKVDKNALSSVVAEAGSPGKEYIAPSTHLEISLASIWKELLGAERVGIKDNFFELGGHSLLAMRVISLMRKELQMDMSIKELFVYPTIESLAAFLSKQNKIIALAAPGFTTRPQRLSLSFSQERFWFIDRLEGTVQYHMPFVLRLKGNLNKPALRFALDTIVKRHEVLRTVIREEEGETYQHIKPSGDGQLTIVDGSQFGQDKTALRKYIDGLIDQPFNLSKDDMMRATLVELSSTEHLLVLAIHHIAADGWSIEILKRELAELYLAYNEGRPADLPVLKLQYADYALWQRKNLQGDLLQSNLEYWKKKLSDVAPLQLPTDHVRPLSQSTRGASYYFAFDKSIGKGVQQLSRQYGTTSFMTLLSAFKVLLYRYSGQGDICVGTSIADRQQEEIENLIGFFVNTLALRST
ncbi:MAG TPA: amino acid adenylation domain-containing protein, partial [Chitinophagaceae bacterium]|nr:amino acid adenylation domain-containing protein [Chitinophagaceae bacterium]